MTIFTTKRLAFTILVVHAVMGQYNVERHDPFAMLSATLQTYQEAACDGQDLTLECPSGTKVSIQLVQYGRNRPSHQLCPPSAEYPRVFSGLEGLQCHFPTALKVIEERCHGQEMCHINVSPDTFTNAQGLTDTLKGSDPCPGYRKYAEVAFKCKPTQFKSRVVCHSETLQLECPANHVIAIYSASFASASGSHIYCPVGESSSSPTGSRPASSPKWTKYDLSDIARCESSFATENVMHMCHGKNSCFITADGVSLGVPACHSGQNVYLKTVYTCVNAKVLKNKYRTTAKATTISTVTTAKTTIPPTTSSRNSTVDTMMLGDLSSFVVATGKASSYNTDNLYESSQDVKGNDRNMVVGFLSHFYSNYIEIRQNKAEIILFASLSVAVGLTLFLILILWGVYRSHRLNKIKRSVQAPPINAYYSASPPPSAMASSTSPTRGDFFNLEEAEVDDQEIDSQFRDPAPEPLILASVHHNHRLSPQEVEKHLEELSNAVVMPTSSTMTTTSSALAPLELPSMRRSCSTRESLLLPPTSMYHHHQHHYNHQHPPQQQPEDNCDIDAPMCSHSCQAEPPYPEPLMPRPNGILRNSLTPSDAPSGSESSGSRIVRYSTINNRPRVSSPTGSTFQGFKPDTQQEVKSPRSLTLSRVTANQDNFLYG